MYTVCTHTHIYAHIYVHIVITETKALGEDVSYKPAIDKIIHGCTHILFLKYCYIRRLGKVVIKNIVHNRAPHTDPCSTDYAYTKHEYVLWFMIICGRLHLHCSEHSMMHTMIFPSSIISPLFLHPPIASNVTMLMLKSSTQPQASNDAY